MMASTNHDRLLGVHLLPTIASELLCIAEFEVAGGIVGMGSSPSANRWLGYITGGRFSTFAFQV